MGPIKSLKPFVFVLGLVAIAACAAEPRFDSAQRDRTEKLDMKEAIANSTSDQCLPTDKSSEQAALLKKKDRREMVDAHTLIVDSIGDTKTVLPSDPDDLKNHSFDTQLKTIAARYAEARQKGPYADAIAAKRDRGVLIYVNGGLNTYKGVQEQAAAQIPCMMKDGYFPIFLIWRTGPLDTYSEQNNKIRDGVLSDKILPTAPVYYLTDIARGLIRAPLTLWDHTRGFVAAIGAQTDCDYHVRVVKEVPLAGPTLPRDPKACPREAVTASDKQFLRYKTGSDVSKNNNVIYYPDGTIDDEYPNTFGYYFNYSATTPLRIVTTPFVDSLGETGWENMVRRSRMTIRTAWEFQENFFEPEIAEKIAQRNAGTLGVGTSRDDLIAKYPNGTGAFSRFFQELERCLTTSAPPCVDENVNALAKDRYTLIGHSMGTIILSDLLFLYPSLDYRNIVYMGAAASVRHVRATVVPLLETRGGKTHFYSLMLHPVAEMREVTAGGVALSGSLLEWVDDMYENPKTFADRAFGKWRNILATKNIFPEEAQKWMLFKVFAFRTAEQTKSPRTDPIRHGEFNDTEKLYWLPDFWGAEPNYAPNEKIAWSCRKDVKCEVD